MLVDAILGVALAWHGFALFALLGWWWAEALDHLMVHVALVTALGAGLAGARRQWGRLAGLALLTAIPVARWWPMAPENPEGGEPVRVLFSNVHAGNPGRRAFLELVEREDPDIVGVVEVSEGWARSLAALEARYPHHLVHERDDPFGLAVYSRLPLGDPRVVELGRVPVPSLVARLPGEITLVVTHPPAPVRTVLGRMRRTQLGALEELLREADGRFVAIGDLNAAPWAVSFPAVPARGSSRIGTWPAWWGLPLDHVLAGPVVGVDRIRRGPAIGSDHRPLIADLRLPPVETR